MCRLLGAAGSNAIGFNLEIRNETETEGERSRVVMGRAYLSTSHLLFYNSPWKGGSLEVPLSAELMTSAEGIWRTLEKGRQLFKQRLFVLVTIPVFHTLVPQSVSM